MSINKHKFKLLVSTPIKEINGTAHLYKHEYMRTQLLYLQNDDDNKVFTAAFATPPTDHSGVAHIVEHSVLSGSRKYRTKEPFMDLIKGSLQTFLNAITFSDKTIYPVASRNDKDFSHLVDVYLDSVFFPRIYEEKSIFMQEGWSYKISDKKDPLTYNGVVFNEMKGSYSDPSAELSDAIHSVLFPDTCYAFSSGGRPENITDLTYDNFLNFHKEHYHPTDAKLLFYGDLDIDKFLEHIENDYLLHFTPKQKNKDWLHRTLQKPLTQPQEHTCYYPVAADDNMDNKYWISQNFVFGEKTDIKLHLCADILKRILINATSAPLRKVLMDKQIGEDIITYTTDTRQVGFSIVAKNINLSKKEEFINIIDTTLRDIVNNGLNMDLVNGSIKMYEYRLREGSQFPIKGLMHHINILDNWLYDEDPISPLQYEKLLEEINHDAQNGYFEQLIKDYMLDNNHSAIVILQPKPELNKIKEAKETEKLQHIKEQLSDAQLNELIRQSDVLIQKQTTPDTKEDIATIPKLTRDDIDPKVKIIPQEVSKLDMGTFLYHDIFTSGISYIDFIFDINDVPLEDMPFISMLCYVLGQLNTTRSYMDLTNDLSLCTGIVNITPQNFSPINHEEEFQLKVTLHTKYLADNHRRPLELLKELITQTDFSDVERISTLIKNQKSSLESGLIYSGNDFATKRSLSYISKEAYVADSLYGIEYYQTICKIIDEKKFAFLAEKLKSLYSTIFSNKNLHIAFTGDRSDANAFIKDVNIFTDGLTNNDSVNNKPVSIASFNKQPTIEALTSTSMVQFVSQTTNFAQYGYEYQGNMNLLSSYLNAQFLHNKVRAQGGAYGCGMQIGISGNMSITSYRDPNMFETVDIYEQIADYLENLDISTEELEPFIISTCGKTDPMLTPRSKGVKAISRYFMKVTPNDLREQRSSILSTTPEILKSYASFFRTILSPQNICILGNEDKIKSNNDKFDKVTNLEV